MVGKEAKICVIGNDVEGAIYLAVMDEFGEQIAWHPSDEFIKALKQEIMAHTPKTDPAEALVRASQLIEEGIASLKELAEEE
jgi:hypothetical protein